MLSAAHASRIEAATGAPAVRATSLGGGCVANVARVALSDGRCVVAKLGSAGSKLDIEAAMLRTLAGVEGFTVPAVITAAPDFLVMEYIDGDEGLTREAELHAADLLAALHAHRRPHCGLDYDTLIGGLDQPNPWTASWVEFFGEQRLNAMARQALEAERIDARMARRVEVLTGRLGSIIDEPSGGASLVHGDVWAGNVLVRAGRIAAFIDPAIYYGHPEVELAFITLFSTFGPAFFDRYAARRGISLDAGFFSERRRLYNLYPLLVHARLFGGSYVERVEATLASFGV